MEQCIVYFSSSPDLSDQQIKTIVEQSRLNNAKSGITGVMLYVRGNIIQVLEGEKEAVEMLYERIQLDSRHAQVTTVLSRPISERLFSAWWMGFETLTDRQLEEITALIDLEKKESLADQPTDHILLRTLKVFYESNRYN